MKLLRKGLEMALTPSVMPELGTKAPKFRLMSTEGIWVSSDAYVGKTPMLVMFICNHCPYVKHLRIELGTLTKELIGMGLGVVGINSNDAVKYPEDSFEKMKLEKKSSGWSFPYLFDETQEVAKAYQAACTPDFFLYNAKGWLVYRGQFDDSRPGNGIAITGKDLRLACEQTLNEQDVSVSQRPSVGCNIKWK